MPAEGNGRLRRLILGACVRTQVNQFSGLFRLRARHVDFADITVRAQEDRAMWAGDGRPGHVYAGNRGTVCLRLAMERVAPCVLLLNLENQMP